MALVLVVQGSAFVRPQMTSKALVEQHLTWQPHLICLVAALLISSWALNAGRSWAQTAPALAAASE